MDEIEISADTSRLDIDLIHGFLSASYWASGRSKTMAKTSLRNSLCFGAYMGGQQVASGGIITDRAVFVFLADIFVVKEYRGMGIGIKRVEAVNNHQGVKALKLMLLGTRDAHGLYEKLGFSRVRGSEKMISLFENEGD